jgi:hypothetical protein
MSAGTPLSSEIFNAREEMLTSDLNRLQALASREVQDIAGQENSSDDSRAGGDMQNGVGVPIDAAEILPSVAYPGGFVLTLQYGSGYLTDFGVGNFGDAANGSPYTVVRWAQQDLAFTTPDAGLPRIDLVVATPATVPTDSAARFILVDPVARAVAPANVYKTSNPLASVQVIAGTPNAQPTSPAVPAGALALFEVYVPAGAANATLFKLARRLWRRSVGVMATYHGILRNCVPTWNLADETAASAELVILGATHVGDAARINRVIIDGEMISFGLLDGSGATLPTVVSDAGANSPFAAAAPATSDKVYYLYLCGGRNLPQARRATTGELQPVVLVESLVPPNPDGRPSDVITTRRGTTQDGALYIGCGYIVAGSTRRKGCSVQGDWIYPLSGQVTTGAATFVGFNDTANRQPALSATVRTSHDLNTQPALADSALVSALMITSGVTAVQLALGAGVGASAVLTEGYLYAGATASTPVVKVDFLSSAAGGGSIFASPAAITDISGFLLWARGWNMRVPRLSE